jgi:hypothetical protein
MKWLKKVAATPLTTIARVVDNLNAQTNDRTNAPSIHAVREAVNNNWLTIYPIGSIYMCVNDINPSEVFGGTWVQIKDRFLLAAGDTYNNGATGGEATHTLTTNEIPSHTHSYYAVTGVMGNYEILGGNDKFCTLSSDSETTGGVGNGAAHNNMPPYLVVKVWKRTA